MLGMCKTGALWGLRVAAVHYIFFFFFFFFFFFNCNVVSNIVQSTITLFFTHMLVDGFEEEPSEYNLLSTAGRNNELLGHWLCTR